jgi:predicted N-formylglutamate amidohydrolase
MAVGEPLLAGEDGPSVTVNAEGRSPVLLVCEHAGRLIPETFGTLGLHPADLERHIAWDIGAEGLARRLSALLDATLVLQPYSRLLYDCNRPPDAADAIPLTGEGTPIPGNEGLTRQQRDERVARFYRPFHAAIERLIDERSSHRLETALVTIHSFTPVFHGLDRDLHIGILHDRDSRFADLLLRVMGSQEDIVVRRNQPYGPEDGVTHTLRLHAARRGLLNAMIEIRNDLIAEDAGQAAWAHRLALALREAVGLAARDSRGAVAHG